MSQKFIYILIAVGDIGLNDIVWLIDWNKLSYERKKLVFLVSQYEVLMQACSVRDAILSKHASIYAVKGSIQKARAAAATAMAAPAVR